MANLNARESCITMSPVNVMLAHGRTLAHQGAFQHTKAQVFVSQRIAKKHGVLWMVRKRTEFPLTSLLRSQVLLNCPTSGSKTRFPSLMERLTKGKWKRWSHGTISG